MCKDKTDDQGNDKYKSTWDNISQQELSKPHREAFTNSRKIITEKKQ